MATDGHGRRIDYLRVSVTDRCNLRCVYCMDEEGIAHQPRERIISYEEIERFASLAVEQGISKVRLTGGEPLVRRGIVGHVERMARLVGPRALALTTNGILLSSFAERLARAGLARVNVSLDTLDAASYARLTRGGDLGRVLAGIDAAVEIGLAPVKVNVVVTGDPGQDLEAFARLTTERPLHVRFIEHMSVGDAGLRGAWRGDDVVTSADVIERLAAWGSRTGAGSLAPAAPDEAPGGWGPARYFRFTDAPGTIGVISPLSHHFCDACSRLRLTADGRLRPCLFSDDEVDARPVLLEGTDDDVRRLITSAIAGKPALPPDPTRTTRRMSQIGG